MAQNQLLNRLRSEIKASQQLLRRRMEPVIRYRSKPRFTVPSEMLIAARLRHTVSTLHLSSVRIPLPNN